MANIEDSGERREFESGAVRDVADGKGRCDLLPLGAVADYLRYTVDETDSHIRGWHTLTYLELFSTKHDASCREEIYFLYEALMNFSDENQWDAPTMLLEVSKHFEDGARKYGARNWEKGIPLHCYIDSAVRHYLKWWRGDTDERHDRAFCWNVLCCAWTFLNRPECNDLAGDAS